MRNASTTADRAAAVRGAVIVPMRARMVMRRMVMHSSRRLRADRQNRSRFGGTLPLNLVVLNLDGWAPRGSRAVARQHLPGTSQAGKHQQHKSQNQATWPHGLTLQGR